MCLRLFQEILLYFADDYFYLFQARHMAVIKS
jgi:hypothetical protein